MPPISPDIPARTTQPPAMPLWLRILFLLGTALTVFLFAMVFAPSSRGSGGVGGWGAAVFYLMGAVLLAGLTFWSFLTWQIYRSLYHRTHAQRLGITLLFFLLPLILLGMAWLKDGRGGIVAGSKKAVTINYGTQCKEPATAQ